MKFLYEYRTPDNEKHQGEIKAADREAAYAALKKQGIKPSRFAEAPGLLNKLFGKGKRWMAIGVLGAGCLALGVLAMAFSKENTALNTSLVTLNLSLDGQTRRQPIGDAAVIDEGIRTGWADVFALEGDRFLASFAIPATRPAVRSTTEEELRKALEAPHSAPDTSISIEERQIRAMVEGVKAELREFLAAGGTIKAYGRKLVQRQETELGYYGRAKGEIENAVSNEVAQEALEELLRKNNAALRKMGIRPVVLPAKE